MTLFSVLAFAALASAKWIVPGARWYDTDGNLFNAHAGGLCVDRESGKFYWFGEHKTEEQAEGGGISVYSSDDLATWESHDVVARRRPQLQPSTPRPRNIRQHRRPLQIPTRRLPPRKLVPRLRRLHRLQDRKVVRSLLQR
ncbi:hypothetical protein LB505_011949 [Fusarium chuoi]|nr:hypothetical protein LB505_011949 [Fusarium chuoi]